MNKFIACSLWALFSSASTAFSQSTDYERLLHIGEEEHRAFLLMKARVSSSDSLQHPHRLYLSPGRVAVLTDFVNGLPYYSAIHNLEGRKTTGVEEIQSSPAGAGLTGEGMLIGVWDEGFVRTTHVEFGGRVTNKGGSDFSLHATHVSGTIAATGVNPNARGMVPEAEIHAYHAFENDLANMATAAAAGLVISNHSYGLILGWNFENGKWTWRGGAGNVDTRFGHYSSQSRSLDNIAYNAPFYTIVRSGGNDRSDVGDGTRPPDGPFDCLGPAAVAKNVLTVGAITGFQAYQNPQSAVMSTFSSWGPTDDGRIKPDVVGDGVNVFSTSSAADDAYTALQGTSMAAPNVAGSIAILQQYYKQKTQGYLTSAALKALVIHSAREAGSAPGPDYSYGWGVVNITDGVAILENIDPLDSLVVEGNLSDGTHHEYHLFSDGRSPITATIAWTDVPATPGTEGSTERKLVNDLDIRLRDHNGNEVLPWTLSPASPTTGAVRADNSRDNVEKIEVTDPSPGLYTLTVSHKQSLTTGGQAYGLIFTGSSIASGGNEIYWVGGSGQTNDDVWSTSSGGAADGSINTGDKTWVFDSNADLAGGLITLSGPTTIRNLVWLTDANATIDLNGFTLTVEHELLVNNPQLKIRNGILVVSAEGVDSLSLDFDALDNCQIVLGNNTPLALVGNVLASSLQLEGRTEILSADLRLRTLKLTSSSDVDISGSELFIEGPLTFEGGSVRGEGNHWQLVNADIDALETIALDDVAEISGTTTLTGSISFTTIQISDALTVAGTLEGDVIVLSDGASVLLENTTMLKVNTSLDATGSGAAGRITIRGTSAAAPGVVALAFRALVCFDFIDLENVQVTTESIVNLGPQATFTNVTGIVKGTCEDVIFPDFSLSSNCANSVINVVNTSLGEIESYRWDFGNGEFVAGVHDLAEPVIFFDQPGTHTVTLTVTGNGQEVEYQREIAIGINNIPAITVVEIEDGLVASLLVGQYTWYLNGLQIPDEKERILEPVESGSYRVMYAPASAACVNRVSLPFEYELVTSTESEVADQGLAVYPNPFSSTIILRHAGSYLHVAVIDVQGRVVYSGRLNESAKEQKVDLIQLPRGVYTLRLGRDSNVVFFRIVKK